MSSGSDVQPVSPADNDTLRQTPTSLEHSRELSNLKYHPPADVPGYRVLHCLGEGAYGSVWLARENNTGKRVAIKFYSHRRGLDWSLLNREVEKLAVLYTSRNIVGLLDVGWDSDPPFYVMEYLENGSLAAFLSGGSMPVHEAVRIGKSILHALVHAHNSGILHCDLKPANVLLDADFEPRLCDFGQSRLSNEQNPALGTLFYMAPEQADMKAVPDARWDVYALGALLYQLLCGEPPYRTPENEARIRASSTLEERLKTYREVIRQSPSPLGHYRVPGVDRRLAEIVDRCLHPDPDQRAANAQAVLNMLEARDRQRARRPLIILGGFGPVLLFAAMIPFTLDWMQSSVETAETNITQRALESDVVSANILAKSVQTELDDRLTELVRIAAQTDVREAIEAVTISESKWQNRGEFKQILDRAKVGIDELRTDHGRELDTSWFFTDANGVLRWRHEESSNVMDRSFAHRDYFHGRGLEYDRDSVPEDIRPIQKPHISLSFRSAETQKMMVAISVPVWEQQGKEVIGVLARTSHHGELLAAYKSNISGSTVSATDSDANINRLIALVDNRSWEFLDHQSMMGKTNGHSVDEVTVDQPTQELLSKFATGKIPAAQSMDEYIDPFGEEEPEYAGRWLAAFAPVGDVRWTVIVQERRDIALRPVQEMKRRLLRYGAGALVVGCILIGGLWFLVLRFLNRSHSNGRLGAINN